MSPSVVRSFVACCALVWFGAALPARSQEAATPAAVLKPGANLTAENIPPIPLAVMDSIRPYTQSRSAVLLSWNPVSRSMLISTRFADTAQVHRVTMPGGDRHQLTFFTDRVSGAAYLPDGNAFLLSKDIGGGEWYQIYRQDADGKLTLLTDGRSRNSAPLLAHRSTRYVYTSTKRNNQDTDVWLGDAAGGAAAAKMLLEVKGGGWEPLAWSPDNTQLVVAEGISANESYLYLVNAQTGEKRALTPRSGGEPVAYTAAAFSHDGRSLYVVTDRDNEFARLARMDLASGSLHYVTTAIPWDVEEIAASEDGRHLGFITNENGTGKLYLLDTAKDTFRALSAAPAGVLGELHFHPNGRDLGFVANNAHSPSDVYSIDIASGRLDRWTESETGGLDASHFVEPSLVRWKSFDAREISGYLYRPNAAKYPGKRPVIINIHGGPEGQSRPTYQGFANYLIDELGVAQIVPNVRGSTGYGKSFLKLDNGMHRDDTYKDIAALLDWIATQPDLDASRVMVYGGSYGGHMTWATAAFYNDRIRCAMPIVGMSNLVTFLEHTEAYRRDLRRVEYGDERDPAMRAYLEKIAPMNHLDAMHKPIFAVAGKNDPRVPWTESRQILDKLNAQGTPTWFLLASDEGHGYAKQVNRDFQNAAEVLFIQTYLLDGMAH